jgi:hypothetical protein
MIIDFHSHINKNPKTGEYEEEELLKDMEQNQIDIRVVSTLEGRSTKDINNYISDFVSRHENKLIGFANINPKEYNCAEETKRALQLKGIYGVEFNSFEHGYFPDNCESLIKILDIVNYYNVPVKVFTGIGAMSMPQQWAIYAKKYPNINFIMLHMGCFDFGYSCVDLALKYENIFVETSNQYEAQILRKAFNNLPENKIIFGTQYPNKFTKNSIDLFDIFELSDEFLEKIYYQNAKNILDI